jgi:hypothetical protein
MTFDIFQKTMDLIKAWRDRKDKLPSDWPDSRDPEFREIMEEFKVVAQDLEKALIALAAWRHDFEFAYQSMSGIAKVIVNRQNKEMFRTHLVDFDQFPYMGEDFHLPEKTHIFEKLLENIDDIIQSKVVDLTQGAIYFGAVEYEMPEWFRAVVNDPTKERTVKIGGLTFYRDKKL